MANNPFDPPIVQVKKLLDRNGLGTVNHGFGSRRTIAPTSRPAPAPELPPEGAKNLSELGDVDTTTVTPAVGDILVWDGTHWVSGGGGGIDPALLDAKGDLIVASASDTPARLPVGSSGQVLTVAPSEALGVKWSTPASGGGGSAVPAITDWSHRGSNRSTSAFAWKGNCFLPSVDIDLYAIAYYGGIVAGATYQAAVVTATGAEATPGTIATIVKSATVTPSGAGATDGAWLWLRFASPVRLTTGTSYGLLTGRTDNTDTYPLPVPFDGGVATEKAVPMPGQSHGRSWRVAVANPSVGSTINYVSDNSVGAGFQFSLV